MGGDRPAPMEEALRDLIPYVDSTSWDVKEEKKRARALTNYGEDGGE